MERLTGQEILKLPVLAVLFKDEDGEKRWGYYPTQCENVLLKAWNENMGSHKVRKVGSTYIKIGEIVLIEKVEFGELWKREDFRNQVWEYLTEGHLDVIYGVIKQAHEGILGKKIYSLPYKVKGEEE